MNEFFLFKNEKILDKSGSSQKLSIMLSLNRYNM